jgi:hypothetical protein
MLRKDLFMRKTNKKLSKLVDDKSGVILVTVIFIVAMALVFITTALTIAIANRQRVYSNAKSDQARLTVTSLSQAIWQAIYSQQINDQMLYELAKGSTNHGSLVTFTSADLPGLGAGGSEATAYFYLIQDSNPATNTFRKIGIECKCEIEGVAQYYTMVLQENRGESMPPKMFNFVVNLGDGGVLNRCVIGIDVAHANNDRGSNYRYNDPDNVIFLHRNLTNAAEGLGLYSTTLTDGYLRAFDTALGADLYCLGANSGVMFGNNPNMIAGTSTGSMYFYGSKSPFVFSSDSGATWISYNGNPDHPEWGSTSINFNHGIDDIYFDSIETTDPDTGAVTLSGFEDFPVQFSPQTLNSINGQIHWDASSVLTNVTFFQPENSGLSVHPAWDDDSPHDGEDWVEDAGMDSYMTVDPTLIDTIDELTGPQGYATEIAAAHANEADHAVDLETATSLGYGTDGIYIIGSQTVTHTINVDLSGGDIILIVKANCTLKLNKNGYLCLTHGGDGNLIILLESNAQLRLNDDSDNCCGIYDVDCYHTVGGSLSYFDYTYIDQTKVPRCKIFSLYTGGYPVYSNSNGGSVALTAFLGFYPQSTPDQTGGGKFYVKAGGTNFVYYGRISAGGIEQAGSSPLLIPYCPNEPSSQDTRNYAYRDATNYSVVTSECGYFTA